MNKALDVHLFKTTLCKQYGGKNGLKVARFSILPNWNNVGDIYFSDNQTYFITIMFPYN